MPISALPEETARILTSSVALNDAVSLTKELVDNALDAHATNITIEIASNTIDLIQVKDNGAGIGVDDRQLLCQRGCTSKIRTMNDLASLGGTSLGFRGEALYSACNVSASVSITTRVEGEMVASSIKFGRNGKMLNSSSASLPVGTTVRVQDFLNNIPVRKQAALKATSKTLNNIRKLLCAYVFARPEVRISFKVLKAKNDKSNWNYAPNPVGTTLMEAATKVVGVEVANQLLHCHSDSKQSDEVEKQEYNLEALLIKPTPDAQKACNSEQFIAVDDRPVSTEKDLMKDLLNTYKKFLRHALSPQETTTYSKPFLCLRILCPPQSYDINVEPAKDRVMFYKPSTISEAFESMLTTIYGANTDSAETPLKAVRSSNSAHTSNFELLLAQKSESRANTQTPIGHPEPEPEAIVKDLVGGNVQAEQERSPRENTNDADNPWTKAKMNVRIYPKESSHHKRGPMNTEPASPDGGGRSLPDTPPSFTPQPSTTVKVARMLTPQISSDNEVPFQNPGPPIPRRGPRGDTTEISPPPTARRELKLLEGWIQSQSQPAPHPSSEESSQLRDEQPADDDSDFVGVVPSRINKAANGLLKSGLRKSNIQQTLTSPFRTPHLSQFHSSPGQHHANHSHPSNHSPLPHVPSRFTHSSRQGSQQELDEILEFERQKKEISQQRRKAMRAARAADISSDLDSMAELPGSQTGGADLEPDVSSPQTRDREDYERQLAGRPGNDSNWIEELQDNAAPPLLGAQRTQTIGSRSLLGASQSGVGSGDGLSPRQADNIAQMDAPGIPDADPRAHLIRQRKAQEEAAHASAAGMTRTGLKIRRIKSTRLPLETIPAGDELFHLARLCEPAVGSAPNDTTTASFGLCSATRRLKSQDEYVKHGSIDGVQWLPLSQDIATWESDLLLMLQNRFGRPGEHVAPTNFSLYISKAIKAHVDEYGG